MHSVSAGPVCVYVHIFGSSTEIKMEMHNNYISADTR